MQYARVRLIRTAALLVTGCAIAAAFIGRSAEAEAPKKKLSHEWREVMENHWQIVSSGEAPETTDAAEGTRGACTPGMVEVKGKMRVTAIGDELQKATCTNWINREFPERCASFSKERWQVVRDKLPTKDMHFCIDRFEFPNRKGEYPVVYVNWFEANTVCKNVGKRLCTEEEWTFACEGEEASPYPYGFDRDKDACITDRPWRAFDPKAYGNKATLVAELDKLWQGVPSGTQPRCKSVYGVYDMTGNVDEWTQSSVSGRKSILKGGYWGPVRTRCRPSTRAHGEAHVFYQQGLRCCSDAP
ncbi:Protein kinase domain protein [Labilithrix luteola]|uniref:Protein kinase domain protein n=1 Tax=Labilithrix luteola TaxID=1391654 RepID=A0A0K1PS09_9BACT|nr:SUMF1/EgtB/PvdO family nonheme iron enzyme [Labilithrix luteola]AKU96313.1 Protein kinase domain protein [Labilithrix luteola]